METLGRGMVAINQGRGKVWVSWRMLGTDPTNIAFNVYRTSGTGRPVKLNRQPLTGPTHFVDTAANLTQATSYSVRPVLYRREQAASRAFTLPANAPARSYLSIPLQPPPSVKAEDGKEFAYGSNDVSVGDLDGDGEYEIVVKMNARGADNSHFGPTDPTILQAYTLGGTLLWNINLGKNIRAGAHYTQFMVYDLDGDGRAEIVCKTADGTRDGQGNVIGDPKAVWVNEGGHVVLGPEYLTVFDGLTGKALDTTKYLPPRHPDTENPTGDQLKAIWGDGYGNRFERYLAGIAYLDGVHPSVVMARGYYSRTALAAWDFRGGKLTNRWVFDTMGKPDLSHYEHQGNHNLSVADVDSDGKDEIIYGAIALDDDGKAMYSTRLGHGDALHVSDLDPTHPGLEVFTPHEGAGVTRVGTSFRAAGTGELLWITPGSGDVGRAMAADIDPRYPGYEVWASNSDNLYNAKGIAIGKRPGTSGSLGSMNFGIWWDGDLLRELLDHRGNTGEWHGVVTKWDWQNQKDVVLWEDTTTRSNNWTKGNPALSADILGDWREEMIWRSADNKELRIYVSTIPTPHRLYTLMHDPVYRLSIAWQNVAYNQPPHPGFYLGPQMKPAPRPNITIVASQK